MQATRRLRGPGIPKGIAAVVIAVVTALVLCVGGVYLAKGLNHEVRSTQTYPATQVGASDPRSVLDYLARHSGRQAIQQPVTQPSPIFQEPGTRRGGSRI